jgi:hypothetical protein
MPSLEQIVLRLHSAARPWRRRLDNTEVKQARLLAQRLRTGTIDVLTLGASESLFVSPSDADQRTLSAMVGDGLAPELSTHSIAGAAYGPYLYKAYLEIVAKSTSRPTVVLGLVARLGVAAWSDHPMYSYARALRSIRRIGPGSPPWRYRTYIRLASDAEFAAFDALPHPTLHDSRTIGDYRRELRDPARYGLSEEQRVRQLYAFHHASSVPLSDAFLESVTTLGRRLKELGLPVVVYQMPIPVVRGVELLGPELYDSTVANLKTMDDAFIAGYGEVEIVQTGVALQPFEFIDPDDATEHVNELGRRRMADMIVAAVHRARLSDKQVQR